MEEPPEQVAVSTAEGINIAFVGCTHGELDTIYSTIQQIETSKEIKIELLLCCGDFEAVRNNYDLDCLAGPSKYHHFKDFYKYYNGEATAPILTIFVGGNHEAGNHLRELYYGGWVAPNIYYLGYSGCVKYGGLRIGGFSGIYKAYDFKKGHYEIPPYDSSDVRSCFHVREYELFKLSCISEPIDILMSHDWPDRVEDYGDKERLLRDKPHFREEVERHTLGCPHYLKLMQSLKPQYWLSGHMHCYFEAQIPHTGGGNTNFIALDKVIPRRHFLHVLSFPDKRGDRVLEYDMEWLSILRAVHPHFSFSSNPISLPRVKRAAIEKEAEFLKTHLKEKGLTLTVPHNFAMTVDPHISGVDPRTERTPALRRGEFKVSPQTLEFLSLVDLTDPLENAPAPTHKPDNGAGRRYRDSHSTDSYQSRGGGRGGRGGSRGGGGRGYSSSSGGGSGRGGGRGAVADSNKPRNRCIN